jgi:hypothetical protein
MAGRRRAGGGRHADSIASQSRLPCAVDDLAHSLADKQ